MRAICEGSLSAGRGLLTAGNGHTFMNSSESPCGRVVHTKAAVEYGAILSSCTVCSKMT